MSRRVEQVEFAADDPTPVAERMVLLAASRDGWINLLPGVPAELVEEQPRPSALSGLFGSTALPVTMVTWMPPGKTRRRPPESTIGLLHDRGRFAARQLAQLGVDLPAGWRVRQDHPRRGLVVAVPAPAPPADVVRWMLRAAEAMASVPLTGRWQARIYLPRSTTS